MKTALSIGFAAFLLAASAGAVQRPQGDAASAGHWQGFVLRNGLRAPVSLDLTAGTGRLSAGDNAVPLDDVRLDGTSIHFAAPGGTVFDGAVAGDTMAGSVSGPYAGSFALTRVEHPNVEDYNPYPNGP